MIASFPRLVPHGAAAETVHVWEHYPPWCARGIKPRFAVAVADDRKQAIVGPIKYFDDAESAITYAKELT